eukprot:TRINITY_DN12644_c0_g2_i1.p1 TRINITY_DN12644_c0_g2~~TRINITY_DN12644_c0_g2_i1.p1  ORF type:complete len:213 (+),score=16.59 TRINITY_DN12644_c0_g2_i1:1-639(+)
MSIAPSSSLHQIRAMLARSSSRDCAPADLVKICNASACRGILACNIRARDLAQLRLLNVSTGRALDDEKAWKDCLESELKFVVVDSNLLLSSQRRRLLEMYALLSTCRCALQTSLPLNSELDMANLSWMMCSTSHGGTGEARILIGHFRLDNGSEGSATSCFQKERWERRKLDNWLMSTLLRLASKHGYLALVTGSGWSTKAFLSAWMKKWE